MNHVAASCGHLTPAIGSPNSLARRLCQCRGLELRTLDNMNCGMLPL